MIVIAHRGATGKTVENTLGAFEKALKVNAQMIELDVHACKSGELVVMHNFNVKRSTNGKGKINKLNWNELSELLIGNHEHIPLLSETLDLINAKAKLNIEIKGKHTAKNLTVLLKDAVNRLNWQYSDFLISSFDHRQLKEFHHLLPEIPIGILFSGSPRLDDKFLNFFNPFSINVNIKFVSKAVVEAVHRKSLKIYVYTINKPAEILNMKQLGVDGIFTDFYEKAVELLKKT